MRNFVAFNRYAKPSPESESMRATLITGRNDILQASYFTTAWPFFLGRFLIGRVNAKDGGRGEDQSRFTHWFKQIPDFDAETA